MDHLFHNELLNEAQCLESISRSQENKLLNNNNNINNNLNLNITSNTNLNHDNHIHNSNHNKNNNHENTSISSTCHDSQIHPEKKILTLLPSEIWSEFNPEDVRDYVVYYSPRTHSQQISFYENWQRHFQPNDKQST